MLRLSAVLVATIALVSSPATVAQEPTGPVESELTEEVEVRFVIVDALVLDSRGEVVPDLTVDDFELHLDLQRHPVESVDLDCPAGALEDPRPVEHGESREEHSVPELPRRIALAVDYKNLPQTRRPEVLRSLEAMVREFHGPSEELMVVAITRRLRVEQPFTGDRDEILRTLDRMRQDPSLWQEHVIPHYDEFDLFDALTSLIRMLADHEGSKAIVLFSDLSTKIEDRAFSWRPLIATPLAIDYDRQFEALATSATDARVAIYPVHSRGLTVRSSSHRLARLAVETGGRFTQYTNDLSLAYRRAQRDLACRYAVGFYDRRPTEDRLRRLNLRVRRRGVRVIHPVLYRFGSGDAASRSLGETVYTAPSAFLSDEVRGGVFPIRPISPKRWEAAVALRFPVTVPAGEPRVVSFGAKLDDPARRAVHAFDSAVTVRGHGSSGGERPFVVVESLDIAPGVYDLSIAVDDPGAGKPRSAVTRVELPPLPRRGPVLVEPLLLRAAARGVQVQWGGNLIPRNAGLDIAALVPLLSGASTSNESLIALTRLCRLRPGDDGPAVRVERTVIGAGGETVLALPPVELESVGPEEDRCRSLIDELTTSSLEPGPYAFVVSARPAGEEESILRRVAFTLVPATPATQVDGAGTSGTAPLP
jgi:VWFA-related protein